jgi:hypothetical protein
MQECFLLFSLKSLDWAEEGGRGGGGGRTRRKDVRYKVVLCKNVFAVCSLISFDLAEEGKPKGHER